MKKTYKVNIVKEMISKFPNASTNAIARILHEQYPIDFTTKENARGLVRAYRDGMKGNEPIRTEEERKLAMGKFSLPKSDYTEITELQLPLSHNKTLILSDIHFPYQDNEAVEIALESGYKWGANAIYLNGDTMDCYQISRFIKDRRMRDMADELEAVREFLKELKNNFNVPIYYKIGNHEDRWENFLRLQAPELLGIADFELRNVLRFNEIGIQEVKSKQIAKAGKLNILHGHEFGHSVFSPVNPARGLYTRAKESSIIGHHHQTSEHSEKDLGGKVVTTWSTGALCGMRPDYMPYNKWNLGFAEVEFEESGEFEVYNKRIINGKIR